LADSSTITFLRSLYHGCQDKSRPIRNHFQSVKSVKSAVKFLWLRRCRAACSSFASVGEQRNCNVTASVQSTQPNPANSDNFRVIPTNSDLGKEHPQSREDFTADGADDTDKSRLVRNQFQSVKSVKSVVKFLWSRLAVLGFLRLFVEINLSICPRTIYALI